MHHATPRLVASGLNCNRRHTSASSDYDTSTHYLVRHSLLSPDTLTAISNSSRELYVETGITKVTWHYCEAATDRKNRLQISGGGVDCRRRRRNVYDKKPQRYAKDNGTAHLTARSDKSVAYVTNNKRLYSTFCTVEANYWQTRNIARPLCASRATCNVYSPRACFESSTQLVNGCVDEVSFSAVSSVAATSNTVHLMSRSD